MWIIALIIAGSFLAKYMGYEIENLQIYTMLAIILYVLLLIWCELRGILKLLQKINNEKYLIDKDKNP